MKLYSWNINGIRSVINKGAFAQFLESENPDILCLQETKANRNQVEIDLPDYYEYWNSADKKGYSGTAIFSKTKPIQVINGFIEKNAQKYNFIDKYGDPTKEGRVISAEFEKFWIVNVYTPNAKQDLSRIPLRYESWDKAFLDHVLELEKTKPVLFCGDFNVAHTEIDLANPKQNKGKHGFTNEERSGFDNFISAGYIDTYRAQNPNKTDAYTWWSHWGNARANNVGWRIDYWMASQKITNQVNNAQIHPQILGSDHCPISIELDI